MILRFLILSYDTLVFGNMTFRLADLQPAMVNNALGLLFIFWCLFSISYLLVSRQKLWNPLVSLDGLTPKATASLSLVAVPFTSALIFLSSSQMVPGSLVTPMALVGSMWVVPAGLVWWDYFRRRQGNVPLGRPGFLHFLVLIPGFVRVLLNPYRENLLTIVLVPFLAALFAGRRPRLTRLAIGFLLVMVIANWVIFSQRKIMWGDIGMEELVVQVTESDENFFRWSPWVEPLRRFHALDSFLVTLDLVPRTIPYREENLFVGSVVRGIVPRFVYSDKEAENKAVRFGEGIWGYDDEKSRSGAAISPSMPGDLYGSGGIPYIFLGALVWGAVLGVMENWKDSLSLGPQAVVTVIFGFMSAAAIERDFGHTVSTAIQFLIVLAMTGLFANYIAVKYRRDMLASNIHTEH